MILPFSSKRTVEKSIGADHEVWNQMAGDSRKAWNWASNWKSILCC